MNNLHDRLERACDVLDDLGDSEARDAVIEAGKAVMAQEATLLELRRLRQENCDAKKLLKEAQHNLHMCNGVFVPSNDKANKYIADLCRQIEEFLNE